MSDSQTAAAAWSPHALDRTAEQQREAWAKVRSRLESGASVFSLVSLGTALPTELQVAFARLALVEKAALNHACHFPCFVCVRLQKAAYALAYQVEKGAENDA